MRAAIVYAYGKDPYMERQYETLLGVFTSSRKMLAALRADGLTEKQYADCLKGHLYDWQLNCGVQIDYDRERGDRSAYRIEPIRINERF